MALKDGMLGNQPCFPRRRGDIDEQVVSEELPLGEVGLLRTQEREQIQKKQGVLGEKEKGGEEYAYVKNVLCIEEKELDCFLSCLSLTIFSTSV